jgi:hypothetical protein
MKKLISITIMITLILGLFTQVVAVEQAVAQNKISSELMSEFEALDTSETTLAYVEMEDVDHEAVMAEFQRRYPNEYNAYLNAISGVTGGQTTEAEDQLLQRAVELKREVYR